MSSKLACVISKSFTRYFGKILKNGLIGPRIVKKNPLAFSLVIAKPSAIGDRGLSLVHPKSKVSDRPKMRAEY